MVLSGSATGMNGLWACEDFVCLPRNSSARSRGRKSRLPLFLSPEGESYQVLCPTFAVVVVLGLRGCSDFSLVAVSRDCSLVAGRGLLTVVASLVGEHRLQGTWAQ